MPSDVDKERLLALFRYDGTLLQQHVRTCQPDTLARHRETAREHLGDAGVGAGRLERIAKGEDGRVP